MTRPARWWRGLVLALFAVLLTAGPASAHSALSASSPVDQATLQAAPTEVSLAFNEPVSSEFSDVVVTGPDGQAWQDGAAQVEGSVVSQPLRALSASGEYVVAYRIVSADGHPVSGELTFTLDLPAATTTATATSAATAAPTGAPTAAATDETTATTSSGAAPAVDPAAAGDDAGSGSGPLIIGLAVAVLVVGAAAVFVSRRRTAGRG